MTAPWPWEAIYIGAGLALAACYLPQIRTCLRDRSGLEAYSLSKAAGQLLFRAAMVPSVFIAVESPAILLIQALDLGLRTAELGAAIGRLRADGWSWGSIGGRLLPRAKPRAKSRVQPDPCASQLQDSPAQET